MIYQGVKVFIDGRSDLYGDAFMKRYVETVTLKDGKLLPSLLDEYRIGWTVFPPEMAAVALLDRMPGWRRVHADKVAVVHMRLSAGAAR